MHEELDAALVERAVGGDANALKLVLTISNPALRRYVESRLPSELTRLFDVEDIVQDAFMRVFRTVGSFQGSSPAAFQRWLYVVTANCLRDAKRYYRAAKRQAARVGNAPQRTEESTVMLLEALVGPGKTPSSCAARSEACVSLQAAIRALPEDYQRAVWMVHIEGQPVRAVATALNRTERAVHGLCRRGLALLQADLGSSFQPPGISG